MSTTPWPQILTFAHTTAQGVGQRLLADFGQAAADEKADGSLVTASDRWADQTLRDAIRATFPHHGVLSEEAEHIFPDTDWCWVIDPIDGTTNFARGIPVWGISLGLLYRGTPVFGYVAMPPLSQHFYGYWSADTDLNSPTGAYLNQRPIRVSAAAPGKNQFFSLCARSTDVLANPFPCKIRMLGAASYNLLLVAAGRAIGAVEATPKIWDIAAVWAIIQAAGGHWIALDDAEPFPLHPGDDYSQRAYPTLVTAQKAWIDQFRPRVQRVARRV